jgi:hypothetical protein
MLLSTLISRAVAFARVQYKGQIISLEDDTKTVRDLGIRNNDEILVSSINSVSITIRVSSNVFVS